MLVQGGVPVSPRKMTIGIWGCYGLMLFYWAFRLWGCFPAFMDTLEYVYPEKWFNVECFRKGQIPLWNPYIACGTPHVANWQSAFFYPFFWVWNLAGLPDTFLPAALLHGLWASVGFYVWLRSQKVSETLASLCAVGFGGSALAVNYWGFPSHLAALSWVPWIFWAASRFFKEPSFLNGTAVYVFWAFQILAGYPFFTFYALLFLLFYVRWFYSPSGGKWGSYGIYCGLALLLTACQWLPFLDFLGCLHREGWKRDIFSLKWSNYLTLLQPHLLGVPGTRNYRGDYSNFIFNNLYLGVIPLAWFLWDFLFARHQRQLFWKGSALFWICWMAGTHFIPWRILPEKWLEVLEPSKSSFLFIFCALTSIGLTLDRKLPPSRLKSKWVWVAGVIWLLDVLGVPGRVIHPVPDPYRDKTVVQSASKIRDLTGGGRMVSLREAGKEYPAETSSFADSFRETAKAMAPNTNVVEGVRSAGGYLSVSLDGFQNLSKYLYSGFPYDGRALDAAGTSVFLLSRPLGAFKYQVVGKEGEMFRVTNAGAMGNGWKVEKAKEFPHRALVWQALLDPKAFLEGEVYLEKPAGGSEVQLKPSARPLGGFFPSPSSPCQAEFQADFRANGYFVFDEAFAPGWHAWVDGKPKPILRAYGLWMAVEAEGEGTHRIVFRYEPGSFRLGLFLSLTAVVALGAGLYLGRSRLAGDLMSSFMRA